MSTQSQILKILGRELVYNPRPEAHQDIQHNTSTQGGQNGRPGIHDPLELSLHYQPPSPPSDDDVVITSRTAFEQARSSRRAQRTQVIDVEPAETQQEREFISQPPDLDLEPQAEPVSPSPPPPPPPPPSPPPPPPTLNCPICMEPLEEATTTKCGHVFCDSCIRTAVSAQPRCPTCRRKVTYRDLFRIYLPVPN